jgi:hypothetical protein
MGVGFGGTDADGEGESQSQDMDCPEHCCTTLMRIQASCSISRCGGYLVRCSCLLENDDQIKGEPFNQDDGRGLQVFLATYPPSPQRYRIRPSGSGIHML